MNRIAASWMLRAAVAVLSGTAYAGPVPSRGQISRGLPWPVAVPPAGFSGAGLVPLARGPVVGLHLPVPVGVPVPWIRTANRGAPALFVPGASAVMPGLFALWNRAKQRVADGVEGEFRSDESLRTIVRVYTLRREESGVLRRLMVREVESKGERPGLPPLFERRVILERREGAVTEVFAADESGAILRGDADAFRDEAAWWGARI